MDDEEDSYEDCQSGPFCRHWSDMECETCRAGGANCGHSGFDHEYAGSCLCGEAGCDCPGWQDREFSDIWAIREENGGSE